MSEDDPGVFVPTELWEGAVASPFMEFLAMWLGRKVGHWSQFPYYGLYYFFGKYYIVRER